MLTITVIEQDGFRFFQLDVPPQLFIELSETLKPPFNCGSEIIEVWRENKIIATGGMHWVGTHAAFPCFSGLQSIKGLDHHQKTLSAEDFEVGDSLKISGKRLKDEDTLTFWDQISE